MKKLFLTFSIFIISFFQLKAQTSAVELNRLLNNYFEIVRTEPYSLMPDKELYNEKNADILMDLLQGYYNDTLPKIRSKAYYLTYKSTYQSQNQNIRNRGVFNLVQGLKDQESGNVGNVALWLTNFKSDDFNSRSKDSLKAVLHYQKVYLDLILKLVGFVGLDDQKDFIKNNIENETYKTAKVKWAAHLALARMGVEDEINFCVDRVKQLPVNDDVVYELIPDLIYTRQMKAFDYIIKILHSEKKDCYSANPENPQKIMCGYRIMEFLALVIKDYPLETDETGDLIVDDYKEALKTVREWFIEKNGQFELIKNSF